MANPLNPSTPISIQKDPVMRQRAHVFAGLHPGQANNIKPVRRGHLSLGSLSSADINQCKLSEFSRLHRSVDLPAPATTEENENDIALKVRYCV